MGTCGRTMVGAGKGVWGTVQHTPKFLSSYYRPRIYKAHLVPPHSCRYNTSPPGSRVQDINRRIRPHILAHILTRRAGVTLVNEEKIEMIRRRNVKK